MNCTIAQSSNVPLQQTQTRISRTELAPAVVVELDSESKSCLQQVGKSYEAQDFNNMLWILSQLRNIVNGKTTHSDLPAAIEFGCGLAYLHLGKHQKAIPHFKKLEQLGKKFKGNGSLFLASYYLGEISFSRSKYRDASDYYGRAVDVYTPVTVATYFQVIIPTLSTAYLKQASCLRNAAVVMAAVQAYKRAIESARSDKDLLAAHTSFGNLYQGLGDNKSALLEYEESIRLATELKDYVSLGWAHGNMGNAYLGLYQKDKALHHLDISLQLALEHEPTPQAIGRAYNNIGTAHQAMSNLDKAKEHYKLALNQAIYGNDIAGQARAYGNLGNVLMIRKDYDPAIYHYSETLAYTKDRPTRSTAHHNRGCALYEKAEQGRKKLQGMAAKETPPTRGSSKFTLQGPLFADVEPSHQPMLLPDSLLLSYREGSEDLKVVVQFHEETFQSIKGSAKGLTLSVSLFDINAKSFHRLQDCLYNLGEWKEALVCAEQSRARALGEMLLQRQQGDIRTLYSPRSPSTPLSRLSRSRTRPWCSCLSPVGGCWAG